jgi:hypothetical protein
MGAHLLLNALLALSGKVEALEERCQGKDGKKVSKGDESVSDASDDEETDRRGKSHRHDKGKAHGMGHGKSRPKKEPLSEGDSEGSDGDSRGRGSSRRPDMVKSKMRAEAHRKKDKKYYAVARGVTPGVYITWDEARKHVDSFCNAMHKSFKNKGQAAAYVNEHRDRRQGKDDDGDDWYHPSSSGSKNSSEEDTRHHSKSRRDKVGYPPTEYMAPDPSVGKKKEFFKMEVSDAKTMTNAMSPPDVQDYKTQELLAGATLDAVQLPGRYGSGASETNKPTLVAEAIAERAEDKRGEWAGNAPRRDVQWKAANRTSLKTITSHEALQERLSELQGLKGGTYENQVNAFRAILANLHWSEASITAWSQLSWYQRIGQDMLENYLNLHCHLIDISLNQGWEYAEVLLNFHATKLAGIRALAPSRLCCMVRIYIYLCDANQDFFYSEKLQEKRNKEVMGALKTLGTGSDAACKKCGMGGQQGDQELPHEKPVGC